MDKNDIKNENSILIVEDNADIFFYLETILKLKNIQILHAKNCEEAIIIFNEYHNIIKLVLLDIRLPDNFGYEIVPDLLKVKYVPIVAQSAYAFGTEKDKSISAGCVDYITKPIKITEINKILNKYFY